MITHKMGSHHTFTLPAILWERINCIHHLIFNADNTDDVDGDDVDVYVDGDDDVDGDDVDILAKRNVLRQVLDL